MAEEIGYVKDGGPVSWASLSDDSYETNPDLQWPHSIEKFDQMRREDSQVGSVLSAVTLPIQAARWEIDPAGAREEVVELVAQDLGLPIKGQDEPVRARRERGRFSWDDFLRLALLELTFGFSVFEQVYRIEDGKARLGKLAWRPPRTIRKFDVANDGGLVAVEQWGVFGSASVRIPVDRLVVFVNKREGANWLGQSLLRQAYKNWLLKDRYLRIQLMVGERNGLGVPMYTAAPLPDAIGRDAAKAEEWLKAQRDEGLQLAKDFRAGDAAGGSLPNGASFELKGVMGKLPDMDGPIRYHDEQIAKAVLAHFLTLGGDNSTGSYALGDTFADFFTGSLNAVMKHIADVTQQHVVEDLVDMNWGPNEPAPRLVPAPLGKEHPLTAEAIRALVDCKALTPGPELEKWLRMKFNLPASEPAAETTGMDAETAMTVLLGSQRGYLASDKVPLRQDEVRTLLNRLGANLTGDGPDIKRVPDAAGPLAEEAA